MWAQKKKFRQGTRATIVALLQTLITQKLFWFEAYLWNRLPSHERIFCEKLFKLWKKKILNFHNYDFNKGFRIVSCTRKLQTLSKFCFSLSSYKNLLIRSYSLIFRINDFFSFKMWYFCLVRIFNFKLLCEIENENLESNSISKYSNFGSVD